MSWITKLAHQRAQANESKTRFDTEAGGLWAGLKALMNTSAESYERLYPPAANGVHTAFTATDPDAPYFQCFTADPAQPNNYTVQKTRVSITRSGELIKANYSTTRPELLLTLAHAKDGRAVIQYDSADISLDRACEMILRPVLFEDVPEEP